MAGIHVELREGKEIEDDSFYVERNEMELKDGYLRNPYLWLTGKEMRANLRQKWRCQKIP